MKSLKLYSYSRCSTCRKAIKWLKENKLEFDLIDIIESPPEVKILEKALQKIPNRKKLFNTSGARYREIGASIINEMSDNEALLALSSDGKLIKRPFLITGEEEILLGFNQADWKESLLD